MRQKLNRNIVDLLAGLSVGPMQVHRTMLVLPLSGGNGWENAGIIGLDKAFGMQCVEFREVTDSGRVPELLAINRCDKKVLILEGQELTGAKQNRTLNTSILLPENSKTVIPVSCTEQGRWNYTKKDFDITDKLVSNKMRKVLSVTVHHSLLMDKSHRSDQAKVWDDINEYMHAFKRENRTRSYDRLFTDLKTEVEKYVKHFPLLEKQTGMAVFVNGALEGVDIVAHAGIYGENHEKILKSYIVDVLRLQMNEGRESGNGFKIHIDYSTKQKEAEATLEKFFEAAAHSFESVHKSPGLGYDHRLTGGKVQGHFLVYEEKPLTGHLFPRTNKGRKHGWTQRPIDFF